MTTAPPPSDSLTGLTAALGDRYRIERELGRGGMGAVFLARDLRLDRLVAIKVLPTEYASQTALRERFIRETRTAAGFSHPNIVPVYAVEDAGDVLAYVMGFVEGETLAERVARLGPLPVRELVRILQDVAYALAYAHGRGVVHRDIKPDNVMLERATGRALVMDFGISRSITPASPAAAMTRVGEVVGTAEYMSPEQASGDHVDGRSDLYSLGLTAHFAATGQIAMAAETTQKALVRQLTDEVPSVGTLRGDLPLPLQETIDRCVEKDPADRFETAEALVEALDLAQLAEPEIPLAMRLLVGELNTLLMLLIAVGFFGSLYVRSSIKSDMSILDTLLIPVVLVAILITRLMTSVSEVRRISREGFAASEIMAGLAQVMDERAERRAELHSRTDVRARRKKVITIGAVMLVVSVLMFWLALQMRVKVGPRQYDVPPLAIVLIFATSAAVGISVVLLLKSPFQMPLGERVFRAIWLGPPGLAFIRIAANTGNASVSEKPVRRVSSSHRKTGPRKVVPASPVSLGTPDDDRLRQFEMRLAELERWRRDQGSR